MFYQTQHFGLSQYFHKEIGKNFSFPMHIHHSFEFITILEGCMTVCVGSVRYELKKGERAEVITVSIENSFLKRRMLDMGITKGVIVSVKKIAPFGDPIDIELRGYELCLRKNDLSNIEVNKL